MDPAVAAFLDSLKRQGLTDPQIGNLAQQQNNPGAWQGLYQDYTQPSQRTNLLPEPKAPQQYKPNMGFLGEYQNQYRALDEQKLKAQSDTDLMMQRLKQAVEENQRQLGEGQTRAMQSVEDRMASQGILRSGITAAEQGKIGDEYTQRVNALQTGASQQQDDLQRQLQDAFQQITNQRGQLQAEEATRRSQAEQEAARQNAEQQARYEQEMAAWKQSQAQQQTQPRPTPTGQYSQPTGDALHDQAIKDPGVSQYLEALYRSGGGGAPTVQQASSRVQSARPQNNDLESKLRQFFGG